MLLPRFDTSSVSLPELIQASKRLSSEVPHITPQNAETKRIARRSITKKPGLRMGNQWIDLLKDRRIF
jgi:hypothetical protein